MRYRAEIDGLRAVAIIPVIGFHARFEWFSGGFVGVDVFFVISGYLITTLILNEMDEGRFELILFYERRARRILPALFFVMLFCIPFAWMWLSPSDMKSFARSLIAVLTFSSNVLFWLESGYFDSAAELKPLLHTWSLAVEEQYYVLFPLLLLLTWRFGKVWIFTILAAAFIASFGIAQWTAYNKPAAGFYLLPTRGWELLIGAFAAFYLQRKKMAFPSLVRQIGAALGLVLILYAVFVYSSRTPFPSLYTLVPTVGAVLIILFAVDETWVNRLLRTKLLVGVGLISYSAYLWHQPLFAFTRHQSFTEPPKLIMLGLCILIFPLAYLSWRFIERPFRSRAVISTQTMFSMSILGTVGLVAISLFGYYQQGLYSRFNRKEAVLYSAKNDISYRKNLLGNAQNIRLALIGDSHGNSLQEALDIELAKIGLGARVYTKDGCPPVRYLYRHDNLNYKDKCHIYYSAVYSELIEDASIEGIIVSARFTLYIEGERFDNGEGGVEKGSSSKVIFDDIDFKHVIRGDPERQAAIKTTILNELLYLAESGKKLFLVYPIPEVGWNVPEQALILYRQSDSLVDITTRRAVFDNRNALTHSLISEIEKQRNVFPIYPHELFCDKKYCFATRAGMPLYYDTNHLNNAGAKLVVKNIILSIKNAFNIN